MSDSSNMDVRGKCGLPVIDWAHELLDCSDRRAREDADELFVSYRTYCQLAEVPADERLSAAAFKATLTAIGLAQAQDDGKRLVRVGCRLRRQERLQAPPPDNVDAFIWACCVKDPAGNARIGAAALHSAYRAWAREAGETPLTIKQFRRSMVARGFVQVHSDGIKWEGVSLRDPRLRAASANPANSGADGVLPFPPRGKRSGRPTP
jgi:hypothetical protein